MAPDYLSDGLLQMPSFFMQLLTMSWAFFCRSLSARMLLERFSSSGGSTPSPGHHIASPGLAKPTIGKCSAPEHWPWNTAANSHHCHLPYICEGLQSPELCQLLSSFTTQETASAMVQGWGSVALHSVSWSSACCAG